MMHEAQNFPVRRALISVSDKTGLPGFAAGLRELGIEIISTGGTATYLRDHSIPVVPVSEVTGFPEILEGRVKTLHPAVHGAILANLANHGHQDALRAHGIAPIGLVVINLYPFEKAIRESANDIETIIENIDIGGSALLRAAGKNHAFVTVVTDHGDYDSVVDELSKEGATLISTRRALAAKAFAKMAAYDAAIAKWFAALSGETPPAHFTISGSLREKLRYGENPHQSAALYGFDRDCGPSLVGAKLIQGKELSYNNLLDADAAFELISEFPSDRPAAAIIKHTNPCGVAVGEDLVGAYNRALACDPMSALGGIIALNKTLDEETARAILGIFTEVVIAPEISPAAREVFAKKPNVRLLLTHGLLSGKRRAPVFRSLSGGFLLQEADVASSREATMRTVTQREPSAVERADLVFAMSVAKHVRSNAIVFAKGGATLGIGAGQMSRVDSARLAAWKAQEAAKARGAAPDMALSGSVVASDAYFPFPDGLIAAADAGATAVIQPGGSIRDEKVIAAADERGLAMIFTGVRHFRH